jgi:hypothetical protein
MCRFSLCILGGLCDRDLNLVDSLSHTMRFYGIKELQSDVNIS